MKAMSIQTCWLFIDHSNIVIKAQQIYGQQFATGQDHRVKIDMNKFEKMLLENRIAGETHWYGSDETIADEIKETLPNIKVHYLEKNVGGKEKRVDTKMTIDITTIAERQRLAKYRDVFVVCSGDSDFKDCVDQLLISGHRVELVAWQQTCSEKYRQIEVPQFQLRYIDEIVKTNEDIFHVQYEWMSKSSQSSTPDKAFFEADFTPDHRARNGHNSTQIAKEVSDFINLPIQYYWHGRNTLWLITDKFVNWNKCPQLQQLHQPSDLKDSWLGQILKKYGNIDDCRTRVPRPPSAATATRSNPHQISLPNQTANSLISKSPQRMPAPTPRQTARNNASPRPNAQPPPQQQHVHHPIPMMPGTGFAFPSPPPAYDGFAYPGQQQQPQMLYQPMMRQSNPMHQPLLFNVTSGLQHPPPAAHQIPIAQFAGLAMEGKEDLQPNKDDSGAKGEKGKNKTKNNEKAGKDNANPPSKASAQKAQKSQKQAQQKPPQRIQSQSNCKHGFCCKDGRACSFAHTPVENRLFDKYPKGIDRRNYKSRMCKHYANNKCQHENDAPMCLFAHNINEARCYHCKPTSVGQHWHEECPSAQK